MDNGMEGMLDTYLFETNSLLDRLDEMLMADEKIGHILCRNCNRLTVRRLKKVIGSKHKHTCFCLSLS